MAFKTLTLSALFTLATSVSAVTTPACYNHPGPLQRTGDYSFASLSFCNDICRKSGNPIAGAMGGNQCWCGFARPSLDSRIPVTSCDVMCNGFPAENCMLSLPSFVYLPVF
jgi:cell wall integrity and stress response component